MDNCRGCRNIFDNNIMKPINIAKTRKFCQKIHSFKYHAWCNIHTFITYLGVLVLMMGRGM